ncbi:homeobox protein NANOG [Girardinichthys multiradiatus]|uniref:homeobox protein NANOG n=1 Tax=Girardinichthys multiradiatus TaxID=208333 RepID=UPI001FAC44D5|nr:homeobox protein NANOG [Girardinichthys multiradiatus]
MAEWKTHVSCNYAASYHGYNLVYQPVPEQGHENLNGWDDNGGAMDLNNYNCGATQPLGTAGTSATVVSGQESSSSSPDTNPVTGNCYEGTGAIQTSYPNLAGPSQEACGVKQPRSDSISDAETHTSPDSWSSISSREGNLPRLVEDSQSLITQGNQASNNQIPSQVPLPAPNMPGTSTAANPKVKVRATFSESQMNILVQRFLVQKYFTPAEMKNLAERTGMTYRQVKTWFQNRRMKFRRNKKDDSWELERYTAQRDSSVHTPAFSNMASHFPPYQGDGHPQFREQYNQPMMGTSFQNTPQNLVYYCATVCATAGSSGYQPRPANASQATVPNQHHAAGWSVPQGGSPFDYNPNAFNNYMHAASFETKGKENTAVAHDGNQ